MTSAGKVYFFRLGAAATAPFTVVSTGLGTALRARGPGLAPRVRDPAPPVQATAGEGHGGLTVFRYRLGPTPGTLPPIVVPAGRSWRA